MKGFQKSLAAAGCLLLLGAEALAQNAGWLKGSPDEKFKTLAEIQPGLGTVMMEYSTRFTNMYYAAKGGNWDLADYEMKEALEIQEVGETTRPKRAEALKSFEGKYLDFARQSHHRQGHEGVRGGVQGCPGRMQRLPQGSGLPLYPVRASEGPGLAAVERAVGAAKA